MSTQPRPIDTDYTDQPGVASAWLVREGDEAAFVETNTTHAVPRLLAALAEEGLAPEQVRHVIVTHIHLDHAGGASALLAACPNATLWCHPRARRHLVDPSRLVASATAVYGAERFAELYGTIEPIAEDRVVALDDGATLDWGRRTLTFLHTRGHANHHFAIHDTASRGVFTGDSFGIRYPALGGLAFPSTSPTDFDAAAALHSLDKIQATGCERVFLTHFGAHTDVAALARDLREELRFYGALVLEALARGLRGDTLDRWCALQVDARFEALLAGQSDPEGAAALCTLDRVLNAQGIAVAVRRARR